MEIYWYGKFLEWGLLRGPIFYVFLIVFYFYYFLTFIFETDRVWAAEGQREREAWNLKQDPGSELALQSPMRGSNSQTLRSWQELKLVAHPTEPPRHPLNLSFKGWFPHLQSLILFILKILYSGFCVRPSFISTILIIQNWAHYLPSISVLLSMFLSQ